MQDPEFEKNVRKKMEELKFSPSSSVWANVEKEIKKEKRSRRPILWLFVFLGIALPGGFYLLLNSRKENINHQQASVKSEKDKEQNKTDKAYIPNHAQDENTNSNIPLAGLRQTPDVAVKNRTDERNINNYSSSTNKTNSDTYSRIARAEKGKKDKLLSPSAGTQPVSEPADDPSMQKIQFADADSKINSKQDHESDKVQKQEQDSAASLKKDGLVAKKQAAKDTVLRQNPIAQQKKLNHKKGYQIGFTGGAGFSSVNENLFHTAIASTSPQYASFSLSARPLATYYAIPSYYTPSVIRPGFSFSAGTFIERPLSRKWSVSIGLNYHYYSTQIQTGSKVNGVIPVNTAYLPMNTNGYYRFGENNVYTNHYHFLEIPVSARYQLVNSKKIPVFWEGGVSYSRLISSDELHFDNLTGVYYKDNSLFNKSQFNVYTAIMIGLRIHNLSFQVGPQVQYGISNLLTGDAKNTQHLFSGGIKIVFVPHRR